MVLAGLQWHQIRQTRFLDPDGVTQTKDAYAVWSAEPNQVVVAASRRTFRNPFLMLGPVNSGIPPSGTSFLYDLPYRTDGYALNIGVARADDRFPPLLTVSLNDNLLSSIQVPHSRLGSTHPFHSLEVPLPGTLLQPGTTNRLEIRTMQGLHWQGHLALIPNALWRQLLPLLVPLSGWCLLASALFASVSRGKQRWFPLLFFLVLLTVYFQSSFIRNMAPIGGFFFSDSPDFIDPICHKMFTTDMNKHPLFMPVVRAMVKRLSPVVQSEITALSAALALIAALNGLMAFLWFRRWLDDFRTAGALALMYAFSLVVWAYSGLYETYPLSSLLGNLFFWVLLRVKQPDRLLNLFLSSLTIGIAALAHPPLLILFIPLVIYVAFKRSGPFPWGGMVAAAILIVVVYLTGQTLIRNYYEPVMAIPLAVEKHFDSAPNPLSKEILNIQWVYEQYAPQQRPTAPQIGAVLTGQFVYSLAGLPYPFDWARGVEGLSHFFRSASGSASLWCILILWIGGAIAVMRSRIVLWQCLALCFGVLVPWLIFFLFFNPGEMLLYSAPILAPILGWLGGAGRAVFKNHAAAVLLAISLVLTIHNAWVLASYY